MCNAIKTITLVSGLAFLLSGCPPTGKLSVVGAYEGTWRVVDDTGQTSAACTLFLSATGMESVVESPPGGPFNGSLRAGFSCLEEAAMDAFMETALAYGLEMFGTSETQGIFEMQSAGAAVGCVDDNCVALSFVGEVTGNDGDTVADQIRGTWESTAPIALRGTFELERTSKAGF